MNYSKGNPAVPRHPLLPMALCTLLTLAAFIAPSTGQQPTDQLLPATTKAYISIPNPDLLAEKWNETQLGQLTNDPAMQPFVEDLRRQIEEKLTEAGVRFELTWDDLKDVYGGEVCFARIQPGGDKEQHASVLIVDISGHHNDADVLVKKIAANMKKKKATAKERRIGQVRQTLYELPGKDGEDGPVVAVFIANNQLVAVDHDETSIWIASRFAAPSQRSLANLPAFKGAMQRVADASQADGEPHIRWFVEPFGMVQVARAASPVRRRRGTDLMKVLSSQGFTAVQALAGHVNFATDDYEMLHRTIVYAPPVARDAEDGSKDRYDLAARILNFPNQGTLTAQAWAPRELSTYASFNWKTQEAFKYIETLVDEYAGEPGFFRDLKASLRNDPNGPRLDVEKELIAHLSDRLTMLTDYVLPITVDSERRLFAVAVKDEKAVAAALAKAFKSDPDACEIDYKGHVIWEIDSVSSTTVVEHEIPSVTVSGPGFDPFQEDEEEDEEEDEDESDRFLSKAAITVANGHMLVSSHIDLVKKVIDQSQNVPADSLADSDEYKLVGDALAKLGAGEDAFRFFSRTDEEYRVTYELFRQGKMPEAQTVLGKLLNRMLGGNVKKGELREQELSGEKLPAYRSVRHYLGPAGSFIRSEENGWLITGILLTKKGEFVPAAAFRQPEPGTIETNFE